MVTIQLDIAQTIGIAAVLLVAVRRAQRRYGLNPVGTVGSQTIAALNVPVSQRIRQIMANMERWRWLPQQLEAKRVQVNIAAAVLTVFEGDNPVLSMKAVTGRPGNETPMLVSSIHSVVLNPPWNVPSSIANKELWPKERANPGYLKRNGFKVIDGTRLQQQAGDQSALGRFKFDFDNNFSVYLHDVVGQIFAMFVLTVAAAEAAVGLAILVTFFRNRGDIAVDDASMMKG